MEFNILKQIQLFDFSEDSIIEYDFALILLQNARLDKKYSELYALLLARSEKCMIQTELSKILNRIYEKID